MAAGGAEKHFGAADFFIFVGLLVVSATIGVYFGWRNRNRKSTDNYFFGDHKMSPIAVAMSMSVSMVSAITLMASPTEIYLHGAVCFWEIPATACTTLISVVYFIPFIHRLKLQTIYEYLERRFGKPARMLCSGMKMVETMLYMGIAIYMPALALNTVTPLHLNWSIALTSLLCTFYTSLGGMKAVVWTDVLQSMIMITGSFALFIKTAVTVGGFGNIMTSWERGERNNFLKNETDIRVGRTVVSILIGNLALGLENNCCSQVYAQRFLSCKNARSARIAMLVRFIPLCLLLLLAGGNALAMYAYYEGCDPKSADLVERWDQTVPRLAVEIFYDIPGMAGLFVSAAYSGTLSTVSSGINVMAALVLEDFIKPCWPAMKDATKMVTSRCLSLSLGLLVMAIAYTISWVNVTVIQISYAIMGMVAGPILSAYVMGIFVPWTNKWGAYLGLIVAWSISAWVSIAAVVHEPPPKFREPLPLSTDFCNYTLGGANSTQISHSGFERRNLTTEMSHATKPEYRDPLIDTFYSLSPFLYGVLGFLVGCVVMLLTSLFTGLNKASEADPELFMPLLDNKKIFPKSVIKFFRFGVPEREKKMTKRDDMLLPDHPSASLDKSHE